MAPAAPSTDATLRVRILGCGCSTGVPRLGGTDGAGEWGACDPHEPRNRRSRCSILVEGKRRGAPWAAETTTRVLVDTAPDLRTQLLAARIGRIDGVLYTHDHADQVNGIDDMRTLVRALGRRVPVHMDAATADTLLNRFSYIFRQKPGSIYPPILEAHVDLAPGGSVTIDGPGGPVSAHVLGQNHGPIDSLGFRFGPIAYSNDCVRLPEETFEALAGVDTWIVDALWWRPHKTHANVPTALAWMERVRPRLGVLTNLHHELDYRALDAETPDHVTPAYDGMVLEAPALAAVESA